jgi:hypothetical protein
MSRVILGCAVVLSLLSAGSLSGAYVEYQGAGGDLNTAANWYVITNAGNPASRTGATRLPAKGGLLGSLNAGDDAFIRNATTTTITTGTTMGAGRWILGGGTITVGSPPAGPTTMYLQSGATMSIQSDGVEEDMGARLVVGDYYSATFNQAGDVLLPSSRLAGGVTIGRHSGATGVYNMTAGTLRMAHPAAWPAKLAVCNTAGATGVLNQSGGTIILDGERVADDNFFIGWGGLGQYNLSGGKVYSQGWTRIGLEKRDDITDALLGYGTGVVNQTGGWFQGFSYRMVIGDNKEEGDSSIGHYRLMGGTLGAAEIIGNNSGHIWLGRGNGGTAGGTGVGKLTITQAAMCKTTGFASNVEAAAPRTEASQLELKINSASAFDWIAAYWLNFRGALEVSFTDGYAPAIGTDWKIMTGPVGDLSGTTIFAPGAITPGFSVELRHVNEAQLHEVHLIYNAARHPGDANNDGGVNVGDLGILAANWQQATVLGKAWNEGDFTGDDIVNVGDLGVLAANWGWAGSPAGPVPEPASLAMLVLGGVAMLRRNRR